MKEFTPYEESLKLKELGFDTPCFMIYNPHKHLHSNISLTQYFGNDRLIELSLKTDKKQVFAPTFSQAFDFLRKKYYLYGIVIPTITMNWTFKTMIVVEDEVEVPPYKNVQAEDYITHEQAELELLKELIKLAEDGDKNKNV